MTHNQPAKIKCSARHRYAEPECVRSGLHSTCGGGHKPETTVGDCVQTLVSVKPLDTWSFTKLTSWFCAWTNQSVNTAGSLNICRNLHGVTLILVTGLKSSCLLFTCSEAFRVFKCIISQVRAPPVVSVLCYISICINVILLVLIRKTSPGRLWKQLITAHVHVTGRWPLLAEVIITAAEEEERLWWHHVRHVTEVTVSVRWRSTAAVCQFRSASSEGLGLCGLWRRVLQRDLVNLVSRC